PARGGRSTLERGSPAAPDPALHDRRTLHAPARRGPGLPLMVVRGVGPDDEDLLPLGDDELEAIRLRATVALASPPGSAPPDPRPRRDALEEAWTSALRLVREVRRLRRREDRAKESLRAALSSGDARRARGAVGDVLDML